MLRITNNHDGRIGLAERGLGSPLTSWTLRVSMGRAERDGLVGLWWLTGIRRYPIMSINIGPVSGTNFSTWLRDASIRAYSQGATEPLSFVKIIIREDFPPDTYIDEAGVYVLIRADDWMAGWLDREPWTRVDLEQTIRILSVLFYGFRLGGRDDLDESAAALAAVVLELPPEIG